MGLNISDEAREAGIPTFPYKLGIMVDMIDAVNNLEWLPIVPMMEAVAKIRTLDDPYYMNLEQGTYAAHLFYPSKLRYNR